MRGIGIAVLAVVGALQVTAYRNEAHAQPSNAAAESRRVKGHVFLLPTLQDSAFVTTHVGFREGFAVYEVPDLPLGPFGTRDITLNGVRQYFDLGAGITDWLGVFATGQATLVTGVDRPSLIADGASVDFVGSLGAVVRLLKLETTGTQVALRASGNVGDGREITVQPLILELLEAVAATFNDVSNGDLGRLIFVPTNEKSASLSAHAAQYINRYLSAQASVSFERGWQTREPYIPDLDRRTSDDADIVRLELAAALELNFSTLFAPISLLGEYMYLTGERTQERVPDINLGASSLGLGIYYVGRPNLQVGVSGTTMLSAEPRNGFDDMGEAAPSGEPTLSYVELILRYVW